MLMLPTDGVETIFALFYCYWVKMAQAHLDITGDILDTIPT